MTDLGTTLTPAQRAALEWLPIIEPHVTRYLGTWSSVMTQLVGLGMAEHLSPGTYRITPAGAQALREARDE